MWRQRYYASTVLKSMADIHERNTLSSNVEKLSDEEDVDTVSIITYNRQPGDELAYLQLAYFWLSPWQDW